MFYLSEETATACCSNMCEWSLIDKLVTLTKMTNIVLAIVVVKWSACSTSTYSDDPSSNTTEVNSFYCVPILFEKTENS